MSFRVSLPLTEQFFNSAHNKAGETLFKRYYVVEIALIELCINLHKMLEMTLSNRELGHV